MKRGIAGKIQVGWVLVSVIIISHAMFRCWNRMESGEALLLSILMFGLSFPFGYIAHALLALVNLAYEQAFGKAISYGLLMMFIDWFVYFIFGYLQWFVLVPYIWNKYKTPK